MLSEDETADRTTRKLAWAELVMASVAFIAVGAVVAFNSGYSKRQLVNMQVSDAHPQFVSKKFQLGKLKEKFQEKFTEKLKENLKNCKDDAEEQAAAKTKDIKTLETNRMIKGAELVALKRQRDIIEVMGWDCATLHENFEQIADKDTTGDLEDAKLVEAISNIIWGAPHLKQKLFKGRMLKLSRALGRKYGKEYAMLVRQENKNVELRFMELVYAANDEPEEDGFDGFKLKQNLKSCKDLAVLKAEAKTKDIKQLEMNRMIKGGDLEALKRQRDIIEVMGWDCATLYDNFRKIMDKDTTGDLEDVGLVEAISNIIWGAPHLKQKFFRGRMQKLSTSLGLKYGKEYTESVLEENKNVELRFMELVNAANDEPEEDDGEE